MGTGLHGYRTTWVQDYMGTRLHGYQTTWVQDYMGTGLQCIGPCYIQLEDCAVVWAVPCAGVTLTSKSEKTRSK